MKTISLRIEEQKKESLIKQGSISETVNKAIDAYLQLKPRVLAGLKGRFTPAEITAIVDSYNGTIFEPQFTTPEMVAFGIADSIKLDGLDVRWSIDGKQLLAKVRALSHPESYFLIESIRDFWDDPARDLEVFVNSLTRPRPFVFRPR